MIIVAPLLAGNLLNKTGRERGHSESTSPLLKQHETPYSLLAERRYMAVSRRGEDYGSGAHCFVARSVEFRIA